MDLGEIGDGLAILGASEVTKDAVQRMLAPTADYIGSGILSGTKAAVNLARVLIGATAKLPPSGGRIAPRALKGVLDEAPFCEDEVMAEYLSGILASSWVNDTRDDRGVAHLATMRRLSAYTLRAHCVVYTTIVHLYFSDPRFRDVDELAVHIPHDYFLEAMAYAHDEDVSNTWAHSIAALEREDLAQVPFAGGAAYYRDDRRISYGKARRLMREHGGLIVKPTTSGTELFLAGCGIPKAGLWSVSETFYAAGRLTMEHGPIPCYRATAVPGVQ